MRDRSSPTLVIYVSTLSPRGIGIAKEILSASDELRALGFEPRYRQGDLCRSLLDIGWNTLHRVHAVVFDGIALGFRYGSLLNMIWNLLFMPVFLIWHEYRWVYDRLMKERPLRGRIFRALIRRGRAHHLVYSERTKLFLESLGVPRGTITIIAGCLRPPQPVETDVRMFSGTDRFRVMAAASIQERKGTDIFCKAAIDVCRRLPHVDFYWFGSPMFFEPEFYESCVDMVRRSGFEDRIRFCGPVENPAPYMAQCDILVMPSRDEPLGLSALEAMSFSKTVIAFDVGGLADLMAGYFVLLGQPSAEDLADKIVELATGNREDLIREDARSRVLELFSPEQYARRIAAAIRGVDP